MGDIAQRGNRLTRKDVRKHFEEVREAFPGDFKRKKRARTRKMGGGRTNLLEELGRVEAEPSNPNRRAEISRVHGELNRGYAKGGVVKRAKKFKTHGKDVPTMAAEGGRIGLKKGKAVTKADLAKRDLWTKRELRKRSKIGQRKSKWDIKGGISGHPLNPFRVHAEGKAYDFTSKRKDVYRRTRDDLKKSRDPEVKKVAEGFQKMDYTDKARSDPRYIEGSKFYKEHQPNLTKRTHVGRKSGGRIGLKKGGKPWGTGPKPGTHEFMMQDIHKRKGKAIGGAIAKGIGALAKKFKKKKVYPETEDLTHQKGPYVGDVGSEGKKAKKFAKRSHKKEEAAEAGTGYAKGGKADKKWIQKAVDPKHKGYCTPMTKKTCTPARKALARTFKKKAKTGWS